MDRLGTVMYAAFNKALYHQSQGFYDQSQASLDEDPVLMYKDLRAYFYGRDNNGINAARNALPKYRIKADITLYETLKNLEYASGEIITENIRLSIVEEKFGMDTRLGISAVGARSSHTPPPWTLSRRTLPMPPSLLATTLA